MKINTLNLTIGFLTFIIIAISIYLLYITDTIKAPASIQQLLSPTAEVTPEFPAPMIQLMSVRVDSVSGSKIFTTSLETNKKHTINIPENFQFILVPSYPEIPNITLPQDQQIFTKNVTLSPGQTIVVGTVEDVTKIGTEFTAQSISIIISDPVAVGLVTNITPRLMQVQKIQENSTSSMSKTLDYVTVTLNEQTQYTLNYSGNQNTFEDISIDEIKASHESEFVTVYGSTKDPETGNTIADIVIVTRARKIN